MTARLPLRPALTVTSPAARAGSSMHSRLLDGRSPIGASSSNRRASSSAALVDTAVVGLMTLAVIVTFTVSSTMLTNWNVHYLTSGGAFIEKLHPTTYLTFAAFFLLLIRRGNPIAALNHVLADAKLLLLYLFCWLFLLAQVMVLDRPFTVIIDTFLLPVVLCLVVWALAPAQRRPLVLALHAALLLNVALGYYEYATGHRLFPLTLGSVLVVGEWRSAALLGHPLTASGIVAGYILALLLRPEICPRAGLRLALITFCLGSMTAFGGRTALVFVLVVIGGIVSREAIRFLLGARAPLATVILAMCAAFALATAIALALDLGIFDKMLLRFSSDKGSTLARYATFDFLSYFDWHELLLGPNPNRVNALQAQAGLNYGIENFWISCVAQFGLIHTILLTIGLGAFFVEILRRSHRSTWIILILILTIAASSVSFSSKNIQLAQFIILITLLLPRNRPAHASAGGRDFAPAGKLDARPSHIRNFA
jgi:hypothetical protein